jgi:hypothetical protein
MLLTSLPAAVSMTLTWFGEAGGGDSGGAKTVSGRDGLGPSRPLYVTVTVLTPATV